MSMDTNMFNIFHALFSIQKTVCPMAPIARQTPMGPVYAAFLSNAWQKRHFLVEQGESKLQRIKDKCEEYRNQRDGYLELMRTLDGDAKDLINQMNSYHGERAVTISCQESLRCAIRSMKTQCQQLQEKIDEEVADVAEKREQTQTLKTEMRKVIRDTAEIEAATDDKISSVNDLLNYSEDLNMEMMRKMGLSQNDCAQRGQITGDAMVLIMNRIKDYSTMVENLKRSHSRIKDLTATAKELDEKLRNQSQLRRDLLANDDFPWIWILVDTFFPRPRMITEQEDQQETQRMEELLEMPADDQVQQIVSSDPVSLAELEEILPSIYELSEQAPEQSQTEQSQ